MECYATDLTLSFGLFPLWLFFIFLYTALHYHARLLAQGRGMAIMEGSARREIRKLKYSVTPK